ncbi:MAG TPA: sialidase family protein, partial [Thermoanaerobaculia bacterium]|nr:sialidase family protein [Thermoanaerobaculia bacterium]
MRAAFVVLAGLLSLACANQPKEAVAPAEIMAANSTPRIEAIASPAGTNAAEPFLSAVRDGVLLSWLEPVPNSDRTALRFASYRNDRWSVPRTIVERNDLFVNWADFPSIVEDTNGVLFAHWLQKSGAGTYSYDVRMATSADGGATWSKSFLLNRDGTPNEHGFASMAALPDGGVGVTWLDGRKMKPGDHDHEGGGDMGIRYATVDAKGTIAEERELDGRTCECCTTGMAMIGNAPLIAYRDLSADGIRDISYVRGKAGQWTAPSALHADGWKIDGCPVNGPQVDAIGNRVVVAWFTAANEKQRVSVAFSDDAGGTFAEPVVVDEGKPAGRVDVVMLDE